MWEVREVMATYRAGRKRWVRADSEMGGPERHLRGDSVRERG